MKKIIALFVFLLASAAVCHIELNASAETTGKASVVAESSEIPIYSSSDLSNPLYKGCPVCHNKYFLSQDLEGIYGTEEKLYMCGKCRFQFIIRTRE